MAEKERLYFLNPEGKTHILNLSKEPELILLAVINMYDKIEPEVVCAMREYAVKYSFVEGNALIKISYLPNHFHFSVCAEGSALMISKPAIPTFEVTLPFEMYRNPHLKFEPPKSKEAQEWLCSKFQMGDKKTNKAQYLASIATACQFIWTNFMFAFDKKVYGKTIEYFPHENFQEFIAKHIWDLQKQHRKEHLLDGWDVVSLTGNQFEKMLTTLKERNVEYDAVNVPLDKFCLSIFSDGKTGHYFFEKHGNRLECTIADIETYIKETFTVVLNNGSNGIATALIEPLDATLNAWVHEANNRDCENWEWCANVFLLVNAFMLHYGDVTMDVEEKECLARSEKSQSKHHNARNTVRLFKCYKLKRNWKTQARKKAEITCPAWGVRGHYRHYRNGKVIFIESFVKGKERANYKGKEYALMPYTDA